MSEVSFPAWFFYGMLRSMDWPKKVGLRRRLVVNAFIADRLADQLGTIGRDIGAGAPDIAVKLLADSFQDRNWEAQPPEEIDELLEGWHNDGWSPLEESDAEAPWQRRVQATVPWELLSGSKMGLEVTGRFVAELWFGLTHADAVKRDVDASLTGSKQRAAEAASYGLAVDPEALPSSAAESIAQALAAVRDFEEDEGVLPQAPEALATFVGQRVQGDQRRGGE